MRRVFVLGSTGSIGTQTLEIAAQYPDQLKVVGLAAKSSADLLQQQASSLGVTNVALFDPHPTIPNGIDAIVNAVTAADVDWVVVSVAGVVGLIPTIAAIKAGKHIALASKEVLVAAGELVMPLVKEFGVKFTPIDSEHSAIWQCLQGYRTDQIKELILTASGGPFRGWSQEQLAKVTLEQALNHPTWNMGGKITVDSSTLFNKALETIEAKWLFGVDIDQVKTVIHPQSVLHSLVKFNDGSCLGQLGWPNMKLPISYALLYPDRLSNQLPNWDPTDTPNLTFEPVDHEAFPAINLAKQVMRTGGTMPCVFNAANEYAVAQFLAQKLTYLGIYETVEAVLADSTPQEVTLENILAADKMAREIAATKIA